MALLFYLKNVCCSKFPLKKINMAHSISLNSYFVGHKTLQLSQKSYIVCLVEIVMLVGL